MSIIIDKNLTSIYSTTDNDIARPYYDYTAEEVGSYGCACPVCKKEYTFSASLLPKRGSQRYDFKSYYPIYDLSPGYKCLMEIFHKNRVEHCDSAENSYPKRRRKFRKYYY